MTTAFQAIGDFVDMKAGDMDGDGSDEIVVLSASNATTGTVRPLLCSITT